MYVSIPRDTNTLASTLSGDRFERFLNIAHYLTGPSPLRITPSQWGWESTFAMCSRWVCYATRGVRGEPRDHWARDTYWKSLLPHDEEDPAAELAGRRRSVEPAGLLCHKGC